MGNSYDKLLVHLVFATKDRAPLLNSQLRPKLFAFLAGIVEKISCEAIVIRGYTDHIHGLCRISRTIAVADLCREMKSVSSRWLRSQGVELKNFSWQEGYGAFSVSTSHMDMIKRYILRQEEHHRVVSFDAEYKKLLTCHEVPFEEKYLF